MTDAISNPGSDSQVDRAGHAQTEPINSMEAARHFATPILAQLSLPTGESVIAHADGASQLIGRMGGSQDMQAAVYLAYAFDHLTKPKALVAKIFSDDLAHLGFETQRLFQLQRHAQSSLKSTSADQTQIERVRRLLLAFSRDPRVILLLIAIHLQSLRYVASLKQPGHEAMAGETLRIFSPLANRLGIWQIKWELEDLAFRLLEPEVYKQVALKLEVKRTERQAEIDAILQQLQSGLDQQGIAARVLGRPKNIYSIVKKMRGKSLDFNQVLDLRAFRIIVASVSDCYSALSWVHAHMQAIDNQFDDYIARPKPNGYQSLHTVVRDSTNRTLEIQIRTHAMNEHAEHGVAAHWAYKEAGVKGYVGFTAPEDQTQKIALLRQLLAWERDISEEHSLHHQTTAGGGTEDSIFVLTPDAAIVELPSSATPIDFAYTVHTELGHRCRGAKVDGALVPLSTRLQSGQTVEIILIKEGGPSRDWLNPELGFLATNRAKSKVRAWFNAQAMQQTIARGRELVEKILQREGKTSLKLEELAKNLGFDTSAKLFEAVGKDEFALRHLELLLRPPPQPEPEDERILRKVHATKSLGSKGGVLVVGVDSLLTQLAKCCRPAPPDQVKGFVTRGRGVTVHRAECHNFQALSRKSSGRVLDVAWGDGGGLDRRLYPVDIQVIADDRQGLLRDISEILAKEKMNVIGAKTQSDKELAWMTFTVELQDVTRLNKVLTLVKAVDGVQSAQRTAS